MASARPDAHTASGLVASAGMWVAGKSAHPAREPCMLPESLVPLPDDSSQEAPMTPATANTTKLKLYVGGQWIDSSATATGEVQIGRAHV